MKKLLSKYFVIISVALLILTSCNKDHEPSSNLLEEPDSVAIVFGPSLTELFFLSGVDGRLGGVDRFSTWPEGISDIPKVGDFLSPSLEMISSLEATSIHVVGSNQSLIDLAERLEIPCHEYSFDSLDDVFDSCTRVQALYPEADFDEFRGDIEFTMDSLSTHFQNSPPSVMIVIYLEGDGAITLAGMNTFYNDILDGIGCIIASPPSGSYPTVSVEGILSISPDHVIILDPHATGETVLNSWRSNGLDDSNVSVLSGDYVLIPGARLPKLIREIAQCLN